MSTEPLLPAGYEPLQRFVRQWGVSTLAERDEARLASTPQERKVFYESAGKLAPAALDHLNSKDLASFGPGDRVLMNLMLSLIHVTLAVELQGKEEHIHARGARMMPIVRGHADAATAQRIEQRLQDVPISITVYDQQQLANQNVVTARDLGAFTPGLTVNRPEAPCPYPSGSRARRQLSLP